MVIEAYYHTGSSFLFLSYILPICWCGYAGIWTRVLIIIWRGSVVIYWAISSATVFFMSVTPSFYIISLILLTGAVILKFSGTARCYTCNFPTPLSGILHFSKKPKIYLVEKIVSTVRRTVDTCPFQVCGWESIASALLPPLSPTPWGSCLL